LRPFSTPRFAIQDTGFGRRAGAARSNNWKDWLGEIYKFSHTNLTMEVTTLYHAPPGSSSRIWRSFEFGGRIWRPRSIPAETGSTDERTPAIETSQSRLWKGSQNSKRRSRTPLVLSIFNTFQSHEQFCWDRIPYPLTDILLLQSPSLAFAFSFSSSPSLLSPHDTMVSPPKERLR